MSELLSSIHRSDLSPLRLIYTNAVQDRREFVTILRTIDLLGVRSEYGNTSLLEPQRDILRKLT